MNIISYIPYIFLNPYIKPKLKARIKIKRMEDVKDENKASIMKPRITEVSILSFLEDFG